MTERVFQRVVAIALLLGWLDPLAHQARSETDPLQSKIEALSLTTDELKSEEFSPTSVLRGQVSLVVGGNRFGGSANNLTRASQRQFGATTINYDARLIIDTSFSGKDLLRLRLRSGNFDGTSNSFGGAGPSVLSQLEVAFQAPQGRDKLAVNRLYYQWPIGEFTFTLGPRVEQDDLLAIWPSVYPSETLLDLMTFAGAIGANNLDIGTGAGFWWERNGMAISANYVAANGNEGQSTIGGLGTKGSGSSASIQIGYATKSWGLAAMFSAVQNSLGVIPYGTNFTLKSLDEPGNTSAFGVAGYWQPAQRGWIPSISAGWGMNKTNYTDNINDAGLVSTSQSWSVGLEWQDALSKGNSFGMAVGQPTFATSLKGGGNPNDGNVVCEWWYKVGVTDRISLTPGLFYLSRPLGADTPGGKSFNQLGGLIKTSFSF